MQTIATTAIGFYIAIWLWNRGQQRAAAKRTLRGMQILHPHLYPTPQPIDRDKRFVGICTRLLNLICSGIVLATIVLLAFVIETVANR
ncbi:hypothetical protein [Rhodopila sp.]|uniref:hypothetical protein n=1 Tax=Rhodopila sp. TaxID=2480087 RepID=UPI003D1335BC